ncbi:hypothetical protein BGZ75_002527, partial [Mortierella antarctica]
LDALKTQIHKRVITPTTKTVKLQSSRVPAMEEKRDLTYNNLRALQRVPRDTFTTAHQRFVADHDLGATYDLRKFYEDVPRYLATTAVLYWKSIVEDEFSRIWASEIANASSAGPSSAGPTTSAGPA